MAAEEISKKEDKSVIILYDRGMMDNKAYLSDEDFIIITYTDGVGSIPRQVEAFLKANRDHLQAAAVSGNERRFPNTFAGAADKIAAMFDVPIIVTFDGEGGGDAVDDVVDFLEENS